MSKFILTGDMPKSCSECGLKVSVPIEECSWGEYICPFANELECEYGGVNNKYSSYYGGNRHPQCPLQDTTEYDKLFKDILFSLQCIDTNGTARDNAVNKINKLRTTLGGTDEG